jgi:hypothetical protein
MWTMLSLGIAGHGKHEGLAGHEAHSGKTKIHFSVAPILVIFVFFVFFVFAFHSRFC